MHCLISFRVGIVVATVLATVAGPADAQQTFELRGRVVDSISGQPLQDAVVRLPVLGVYTLTDGQGLFRFAAIRSATHLIEITQLGYGEQSFRVLVRPDSFLVLRIAPQPVRLDTLFVDSRIMHRTAQHRAQVLGYRGLLPRRAIFWDEFDRDKILASGIDDPFEFLDHRRGANLSFTICPKQALPAGLVVPDGVELLCLRAPFQGGFSTPVRRSVRTGLTRGSLTERSLARRPPVMARGLSMAIPAIYLDDRPVSLEQLKRYTMSDIGRVETYGMRGEEQIRVYTNGYLRLVSMGVITPDVSAPPLADIYLGLPVDPMRPMPQDTIR